MKSILSKLLLASGVALATLGFSNSAQAELAAPTAPYAVYSFSGNCIDCAEALESMTPVTVTGQLMLQAYTPGGAVDYTNFYSLSYSGSNLFDAFTVFGADVVNTNGFVLQSDDFPAVGATTLNFYATFEAFVYGELQQVFFETLSDGTFRLGTGTGVIADNDHGDQASWTLSQVVNAPPPPNNDVPEPGSLLLVGAALVAVGVARRRRV